MRNLLALCLLMNLSSITWGQADNLVPNGGFEKGETTPEGWTCYTAGAGKGTVAKGAGGSCLEFTITGPDDIVRWQASEIKVEPGVKYTLKARGKANDPAARIILICPNQKQQMQPIILSLPAGPDWQEASLSFTPGKNTIGPLYVYLAGGRDARKPVRAWVDDISLTRGEGPKPLLAPEVAYLSESPKDKTSDALQAIYKERLGIFSLAEADWDRIVKYPKLVILARDPENLQKIDWPRVRQFVEGGKTAVLDLQAYAAMFNLKAEEKSLPAERPLAKLAPARGPNQERNPERRAAMQAEKKVPTPLIEVRADDELSAGYPVGSLIPWFGTRDEKFVQRQIAQLPAGAKLVAKSSLGGGAVWLRQELGKGRIFAIDLASLDEPTLTWKDRGSYNKYAPLQNALGHGLRYGVYWNHKPTWDEYRTKLQELAQKYPALTLTNEGFRHGYNRVGLCIGNPQAPIYVFSGMAHGASEYRSGMYGLYAFADYLGRHAQEEPLKSRLQQIGIKIIPVIAPELYIAGDFDRIPQNLGTEEKGAPSFWSGQKDNIVAAIQMHHGVGPLHIAYGWSMGHGGDWSYAIYHKAFTDLYPIAPSAYWEPGRENKGPQPLNEVCVVGPNHITWDTYFDNPVHYEGVPTINPDILRRAKLNVLAEHTIYGLGPEDRWGGADLEYASALLSDQTGTLMLASILVDPVPDAVPERPEKK